ncbi:MAG: hypothetical protein M3Y69_00240 [Verrucomicrobiota bacterium]|nr:hypothetical protein [Verrucomicrobiota bacterium]
MRSLWKMIDQTPNEKQIAEREAEAQRELLRYCEQHPASPTAVRRPRVLLRGRSWIALLGYTLQDGVAGIGGTVGAALRAFDVQYLASIKSPRR